MSLKMKPRTATGIEAQKPDAYAVGRMMWTGGTMKGKKEAQSKNLE